LNHGSDVQHKFFISLCDSLFFTHTQPHTQIVALKSVFSSEGKMLFIAILMIFVLILFSANEKRGKKRGEIIIKRAFQSINELMHINGTLK
jgi:hypothetical protein